MQDLATPTYAVDRSAYRIARIPLKGKARSTTANPAAVSHLSQMISGLIGSLVLFFWAFAPAQPMLWNCFLPVWQLEHVVVYPYANTKAEVRPYPHNHVVNPKKRTAIDLSPLGKTIWLGKMIHPHSILQMVSAANRK